MKSLKTLVLAIVALFAVVPMAASAAVSWTDYTPGAFTAAQQQGKIIVVDVHADWCPTCRAQQPILDELRKDERLTDAVFIRVNFDDDKAFLRAHRVPRQSTIIVFDGKEEKARSIAETNRNRLRAMILGAV